MRGAGGTEGGYGAFLAGLIMICSGVYWLLNVIVVSSPLDLGMRLYSWGDYSLTAGMLLMPFLTGIGIIFYRGSNRLGWLLVAGSLITLVSGVLKSTPVTLRAMSVFDLLLILLLCVGGLGLFLRSFRPAPG